MFDAILRYVLFWTAVFGVMAVILLAGGAASAQQPCNDRTEVISHLAKKYQEVPVAVGLTNDGRLLELLMTGDGETWTILVTTPDGRACMIAAGEGWRSKEKISLDPGA